MVQCLEWCLSKCKADPGMRKPDVEGGYSEDIPPWHPREEWLFRNGEPHVGRHIQMFLVFYLDLKTSCVRYSKKQPGSFALLFTLFGTNCLKHHSSLKQGKINLECPLSWRWEVCLRGLLYLPSQINSEYRKKNPHIFQCDAYSYIWRPLEIIKVFPLIS